MATAVNSEQHMGIVTLPPIPEGWWRNDQYRRIFPPDLPTDLVDAAMHRAYEVFDPEWRQGNLSHPAILAITLPGTLSLHFMFELGIDLLSVDKCPRYRRVLKSLRKPREYFAARTELAVAATLRRKGHEIEFQPLLPNKRRADLITESHGQTVYIEIKKLLQSDARWLLDRLSFALLLATGEIFRTEPYSKLQSLGYEIRITETVFDILGGDKAANEVAISRIVSDAVEEAKNRLGGGEPPFCFPAGECVHLRIASGIQSSVSEPPLNPEHELRRSLAQHFESPADQLHPDHPGLLIIESSSILELSATRSEVERLLCALGDEASSPRPYSFPFTHPLRCGTASSERFQFSTPRRDSLPTSFVRSRCSLRATLLRRIAEGFAYFGLPPIRMPRGSAHSGRIVAIPYEGRHPAGHSPCSASSAQNCDDAAQMNDNRQSGSVPGCRATRTEMCCTSISRGCSCIGSQLGDCLL